MTETKSLTELANELKKCSEVLANISDKLIQNMKEESSVDVKISNESDVKIPSFQELRGILAESSRMGYTKEIKALLTGYGVDKLSSLPEDKYLELLKAVEGFKDGR